VIWHENTAGDGSAFVAHVVATAADSPFTVSAADIDRDGDADVLVSSEMDDRATWYENTGGGAAFVSHLVSTASGIVWAVAADVDRDGDLDVLTASNFPGGVLWHENTGGGTGWTTHTVGLVDGGSFAVTAEDVDADGDTDVVMVGDFAGIVQWFENVDGAGGAWTVRTVVEEEFQSFSRVAAADLDGDGDLDFAVGGFFTDRVLRFRNDTLHSTGCFAPPAAVFTQAAGAYSVAAADLDGDGDLDPVSASYADNAVRWYPNENHAAGFLLRTVSTATSEPVTVRVADVDGDGDPDVVASAPGSGLVGWFQNLPGDGWTLRTIAAEPFVLGMDAVSASRPRGGLTGKGTRAAVTNPRPCYFAFSDSI
jgi:hypothetical protein